MSTKYENLELCAKCKGKCCIKGGCIYAPSDFDSLKSDYLINELAKGFISVASFQDFHEINNQIVCNPMLYLRARNIDKPIIDLVSLPSRCIALNDDGCTYDFKSRPSGGVNLIPMANNGCYPEKDPFNYLLMWHPYQDILRNIVKRFTGKTVNEIIHKDIYYLFLEILIKQHENKLVDADQNIINDLPLYISSFPEEHYNALISYHAKYVINNEGISRVRKK